MENFLTNSKQFIESEEDVSIQLPVPQENLINFEKYQDLENKIQILTKRVDAIHELVSRFVEVNILLQKQQVPMYTTESLDSSEITTTSTNESKKLVINLLRSSDGEKIYIKGKTFDIKEKLKSKFQAKWNTNLKLWECDNSYDLELRNFLNESNFEIL